VEAGWSNDWYLCRLNCTPAGGGAVSQAYIFPLNASNAYTFQGLDQDSIYAFGAQLTAGAEPSVYIPTTTAALTRTASSYRLSSTGNIYMPNGGARLLGSSSSLYGRFTNKNPLSVSDGTADNRVEIYIDTDGTIKALSRKSGGTNGDCASGVSAITSGKLIEILCAWNTNVLDLWVDGIKTTDATVDIPSTVTQICIGENYNEVQQCYPFIMPPIKYCHAILLPSTDRKADLCSSRL